MWQVLVQRTSRWVSELSGLFRRGPVPDSEPRTSHLTNGSAAAGRRYQPLERLLLTDGVSHTLFEEYAAHRDGARGDEETGWVLLGLREANEAVALATLPAGAECEAGVAHVRFNMEAQAVASRMVRQHDRRLTMLGVVHTHPGSLRHPSDADFRGDSQWVGQLRGQDGIFGIGTADGNPDSSMVLGRHPRPHMQSLGSLCLSWYALRHGAGGYRPLPVELVLGPDLARPLHSVWTTIEAHAERLDRLARQQAGLSFAVVPGNDSPALAVTVPLAEPGDAIRVLVKEKQVRYYLVRSGDLAAVDPPADHVDQAVYLLLAELAAHL
jgi:proteasome lid subunit RPN8/RPN11